MELLKNKKYNLCVQDKEYYIMTVLNIDHNKNRYVFNFNIVYQNVKDFTLGYDLQTVEGYIKSGDWVITPITNKTIHLNDELFKL